MLANKIMIVEDEGVVAMDIRNQLNACGYEVVATAFSGGQAISLATKHKPEIIIMDIVLKGDMDGISAAQTITNLLHIPIIFLTAYSDSNTLSRASSTGAYGYLIKPYRIDELHASIAVALCKHQLEQKLKESKQWFAKTLHSISDAVIATDAEGKTRFMNQVAEEITGLQIEQSQGKDVSDLMTLYDESIRSIIANPIPNSLVKLAVTPQRCPTLLVNKVGVEMPIDYGAAPILDDDGTLLGAVMVFRDITPRRQMETLLRDSEERFHNAFNLASIGMALVSIDRRFLQVNSSLCEIFGYSEEELSNATLQVLTHVDDHDTVLCHYLRHLLNDELPSFQLEMELYHKIIGKKIWALLSASLVRNAAREPQYYIIQIQNITDRKYAEQQLVYIANHDPLTGLFNRLQFHDRLTQALISARRHDTKLALMFFDLDRFKLINDTLGHRIGDLLLQAVGKRLKKSVRSSDILARLGGDEFVVLLGDIIVPDDIARIAQKTIDMLSRPFTLEGHDIVITASVGITIFPDDGENSQNLLMNADTAMYLAKERGKNNYQFYTQEMTSRAVERMTIERGLRLALVNHELKLHYQPQVDSKSGRSVKVEALVRWQHPEWGLVYPDRFLEIAEETGLIVPIGTWVLRTACLQAKSWQENDGTFTHVAVNISSRQFLDHDLFESITTILEETGLNSSALELEITESAVMQDPEWTLQVLKQLHKLGVRLSIDDFGTGYSSLTYLRQFPVHTVKIDKSFVQDLPTDEGSASLVRSIIALAHELKLEVISEGVETEQQLAFLKTVHCDKLQGHLFSRAATPAHLAMNFNPNTFIKLLFSDNK